MVWEDVGRILMGNVSRSSDEIDTLVDPIPTEPSKTTNAIIAAMKFMDERYSNVTEMDATARILVIVNEILRELPESVHVQLQPSHENHPDFFLFTSRNTPLLLIEVKKIAINTLLRIHASKEEGESVQVCTTLPGRALTVRLQRTRME